MFKIDLFPFPGAVAILLIALPAMAQDTTLEKRMTLAEIAKVPTERAGTGTSGLSAVTTTVLYGDPNKPGLYTIELRIAPNTVIPAHKDTRTATVLSGTWYFGYGPRNETSALRALPAGSFYTEPGGVSHFARTRSKPAVVVITGYGPSDTVFSH